MSRPLMDEPARSEPVVDLAAVVADVRHSLDDPTRDSSRILSVYLYGSVLWGAFDPATSDVDLIVVVADDPPVMESYKQVRRFARALPDNYRLDISTSLLDQVGQPVPCRPFILQAAADHGWLLHGRPTLPAGQPLDPSDLSAAIDFELRQLSRNHAGLDDDCWQVIISRQIKAHLLRISQLLHSRHPQIPFVTQFEPAVRQAAALLPPLHGHEALLALAGDANNRSGRVDQMMEALVHLRDAVRAVDAVAAVGPVAESHG